MAGPACRPPRRIVCRLVRERRDLAVASALSGPCDAATAALKLIGDAAHEHMLVLYTSAANCITSYNLYTTGGINSVQVDPAALLRNAIYAGAVGLITAHNHPSGRAWPSDADRQLWSEVSRRAAVVGISHLDDLVLGEEEFYARSDGRTHTYDGCTAGLRGRY